jgi:Translation initiation factor IF-3, N-terminal domain
MRVRMNEAITEESVLLYGDDGTLAEVPLADALQLARDRSMDLVEEWERPRPPRPGGAVVCRLLRVGRPLVWERTADASAARGGDGPELDPELWFHTEHCEGRHYVLGNGHTFRGRIHAWCPAKRLGFRVSKSDITECSRETTYYVQGLLAGQEPAPPVNDEGDLLPSGDPEYRAWVHATELFRQTGMWNDRFRSCEVCGARLLPSNPKPTCWNAHEPR